MPNIKENFVSYFKTSNTVGLVFLFIAVIGMGIALVGSGAVALTHAIQKHNHTVHAKQSIYRPDGITTASSNEKANPGIIGLYLNGAYAGAILEDGTFTPADPKPAGGILTIFPINPATSQLPISARFPAQKITITDTSGTTVTACMPETDGNSRLWVDKSGTTFLEQSLTLKARSC